MRTRTNIHLDNDALAFASSYANAKGVSLGVAISELILRAEQIPTPPIHTSSKLKRDSHGFLVVKTSGSTLLSEKVLEESEDDLG
jgi:hypothetical protein